MRINTLKTTDEVPQADQSGSVQFEQNNQAFQLFNYLENPVFLFDYEGNLVFCNKSGAPISSALSKFIYDGQHLDITYFAINSKAEYTFQHAEHTYNCVTTCNNVEKYFIVSLNDISAKQKELDGQNEKVNFYEQVLNNVPVDLVIFDADHKYVFVNRFAIKNDEIREWVLGKNDYDYVNERGMSVEIADRRKYYFNKCINDKRTVEVEDETVSIDNVRKTTLRRFTPLYNTDGSLLFVLGFGIDITERKQSELDLLASKEFLRNSLDEKEVLLKEVHHRVKNNLSVIYSLLEMDASKTDDEAMKLIFESSQSRVKSMAIVHENLYRSNIFSKLNTTDYARKLWDELAAIYVQKNKPAVLQLSHEQLFVNMDQAVPLGLILNELIVNFFKYVYTVSEHAIISISFSEESITSEYGTQKYMVLGYTDNGPGFDTQQSTGTGVGLILIKLLSKQIKGEMSFRTDNGYQMQIKWKI